jgi:2-methylcitrate dehydratase PrpD
MSAATEQVSPLMHELSGYIAGALKRKLPEAVAERAKIHLVDTFGATISGSRLPPGKRAIAYVKTMGGPREAGMMGTKMVTSLLCAAMANGMCAHADESDDTHAPSHSHPGANVVPVALAIAERDQLAGRLLLRAMVLGYDMVARSVLALRDRQLTQLGYIPGPVGGIFGAAAAAAALLKLDARRVRYVLSYCANQTSGLVTMRRDKEHLEKTFVLGGMPTHNGLAAALMIKSGFTGVSDIFSGDQNFLTTFSRDVDTEALVGGLGADYKIMDCSIKFWPVSGPIQGPLHVLRDLIKAHGIKAHDVDRIVARMPEKDLKNVDNRRMPDANVQHMLAVMLLDGTVTFATGHDYKRMSDPRVLEIRNNRIETVGDAGLNDPLRRWRCAMQIRLRDGRTVELTTLAAKGISENPLSREDAEEKSLDLMAPILGRQRSRKLIDVLFNIEKITDMRTLRRLYQP